MPSDSGSLDIFSYRHSLPFLSALNLRHFTSALHHHPFFGAAHLSLSFVPIHHHCLALVYLPQEQLPHAVWSPLSIRRYRPSDNRLNTLSFLYHCLPRRRRPDRICRFSPPTPPVSRYWSIMEAPIEALKPRTMGIASRSGSSSLIYGWVKALTRYAFHRPKIFSIARCLGTRFLLSKIPQDANPSQLD